jgi:ADP-heptose:LPS heptosyltransferase
MKGPGRLGRWVVDRAAALGRGTARAGVPPEPGDVRWVLVVRPHNQMGDMLLGTPLLTALRSGYPEARIALLASPDNYGIMEHHPAVDELRVYDKRRLQAHPSEVRTFLAWLRGSPWDLVLMPTTVSFSVTSTLLARLAGGKLRVGGDGRAYGRRAGDAVFDLVVPCRKDEHQTDRNLAFARALGLPIPTRRPSMGLSSGERAWAEAERRALAPEGARLVGIHPGAGKVPNRWPVERFGEVARVLLEDPRNSVAILAGPKEAALRETLSARSGPRVRTLPDLTLRQAAALIERMDLFLCNDTGVMHIAGALGTPTVALFGPTDPACWAPLSPAVRWLRAPDLRMTSLGTEAVLGAVFGILDRKDEKGAAGHAARSGGR